MDYDGGTDAVPVVDPLGLVFRQTDAAMGAIDGAEPAVRMPVNPVYSAAFVEIAYPAYMRLEVL